MDIFYITFVGLVLSDFRPITFAKCDKVLLEESEIATHEQSELNSIQCGICGALFHYKCEIMRSSFDTELDWVCSVCLLSLLETQG